MDMSGMHIWGSAQRKAEDSAVHEPATKPRRDYLTKGEVGALMAAARNNHYGDRDALTICLISRHGLRAPEICALRWEHVHWRHKILDCHRVKKGPLYSHDLTEDEIYDLGCLRRLSGNNSPFVFTSMRGKQFTSAGVDRMLARAGKDAGIEISVTAGKLRNTCGRSMAAGGNSAAFVRQWLGLGLKASVARYVQAAQEGSSI
jgi:integrase